MFHKFTGGMPWTLDTAWKNCASSTDWRNRSWRTDQGIYFPAGTQPELSVHRNSSGYHPVPWYDTSRIFYRWRAGTDCFQTGRLFWKNRRRKTLLYWMGRSQCTEKPDGTGSSDFTRRWTVRSLSAPWGGGFRLCNHRKRPYPLCRTKPDGTCRGIFLF